MKIKRKKIPRQVQEIVRHRDKNQCVCCLEKRNLKLHHVHPVSCGSDQLNHKNMVLLCDNHHNRLHLGELETIFTVAEHLYYLKNGELPYSKEQLEDIMRDYFEGKY